MKCIHSKATRGKPGARMKSLIVNSFSIRRIMQCSMLLLVMVLHAGCAHPPSAPELKRDGRLTAYLDGTVRDTKTGLMWAASDSPFNVDFGCAKEYAANFRGGGYTDWRLPTFRELWELYDAGIRTGEEKPGQLIDVDWRVWSSDEHRYRGDVYSCGVFSFHIGRKILCPSVNHIQSHGIAGT